MKEKINSLRDSLNRQIEIDGTQSEEVLELSQMLDILILEYYRKIENGMSNEGK